jgi:hypothetical protein
MERLAMKFGRPRYRKTKTFLGGLLRLTLSKSRGRPARLTRSVKLGPYSQSSTGRRQITLFGITIPIQKGDQS